MAFQEILLNDVYDAIYSKYVLRTTLDMSGDNLLPPGKYPIELSVRPTLTDPHEDKTTAYIAWPLLKDNPFNLSNDFITIFQYIFVFLVGIFVGIILMLFIRKN